MEKIILLLILGITTISGFTIEINEQDTNAFVTKVLPPKKPKKIDPKKYIPKIDESKTNNTRK